MFLSKIKKITLLFFIVFLTTTIVSSNETPVLTDAYFSPREGKLVFNKMYKAISQAEQYVHISIYSWSDGKIKEALIEAAENGAEVRVLLMKNLYVTKEKIQKWSKEMELKGVEVKIAGQSGGAMHEKMIIIDDELVVNSSANMSSGPKSKYSENWIFHFKAPETQNIFDDFLHEFTILWNTGYDVITNDEDNALALDAYHSGSVEEQMNNLFVDRNSDAPLYSMSLNFTLKKNPKNSSAYKSGRYLKLVKRKDESNKQTWFIKDRVLEEIKNAESNISCAFNHLFIPEIATALASASKRGVNVRLAVDNQELTHGKTNLFVKNWKNISGNRRKDPPVRIKFYSLAPTPAYWFLNHHKFCVIDYGTDRVNLISGSYNFSKTAEQKQFDNQVFYKSQKFNNLYISFQDEFEYLWTENRENGDKPNSEVLKYFKTPKRGSYPLHHYKTPISLTWNEANKLRKEVGKLAPGILSTGHKNRGCRSYKFLNEYKEVSFRGRTRRMPVGKYYGCPTSR